MVTLYLTRHGETVENVAGILQGQGAGRLNENGLRQARELRDRLASETFDSFVSSDLQRALHTARIINEPHRLHIVPTVLLRERDWGEFTGLRARDIRVDKNHFPPSVESQGHLGYRARCFIEWLLNHFDGQRVLAIGHGYFNRCIVAYWEQQPVHEVPRWGNAEVRVLHIERDGIDRTVRSASGEISAD